MPGLNLRFRFDKRTGRITELVVDDGDRTAPDSYHDQLARLIADQLVPSATIREDAAPVTPDPEPLRQPGREKQRRKGES